MAGLGELGDKPEATSLRGGGPDLSHSSGLESFMKWFPVGRFVNDIMGRWHDNPKSRVPVYVRDCARGSIARLVRLIDVRDCARGSRCRLVRLFDSSMSLSSLSFSLSC